MEIEWRKSSYSGTVSDDICVELARFPQGVGVQDSKNPDLGHLVLTRQQFVRLTSGLKKRS